MRLAALALGTAIGLLIMKLIHILTLALTATTTATTYAAAPHWRIVCDSRPGHCAPNGNGWITDVVPEGQPHAGDGIRIYTYGEHVDPVTQESTFVERGWQSTGPAPVVILHAHAEAEVGHNLIGGTIACRVPTAGTLKIYVALVGDVYDSTAQPTLSFGVNQDYEFCTEEAWPYDGWLGVGLYMTGLGTISGDCIGQPPSTPLVLQHAASDTWGFSVQWIQP